MSRCGCKLLTELEDEREKHRATKEENLRYFRRIKDLQDELDLLHGTVGDLEKKYSDLSARYRKILWELDESNDLRGRLKDHSSEVADENRRLTNNCERLQKEVASLQDSVGRAKEGEDDERRRRISAEMSLTRDLQDADRSCDVKLRRVASAHEISSHHLKQDISRLQSALDREKLHHDITKRTLHHTSLHSHYIDPFCFHHHSIYDCPICTYP